MTNGSLPSKQILILGIGAGRCGMHSLSVLVARQRNADVTYQQPPFLPWFSQDKDAIHRRFARFRRERKASVFGDVATYYLPYLEHAIRTEPDVRVVCLRRPLEDVVDSFLQWLDVVQPLLTNHWSQHPATGWHHDPIWTRLFPQYTTENRKEAIRRYWTEYYETAELLAQQYPEQVRVFSMHDVLNIEEGQRSALSFVGIPDEQQVLLLNSRTKQSQKATHHPRQAVIKSTDSRDPSRCAVLVPYTTHIVPDCERALKELEVMGYCVRRIRGYAAIDHGRNQMATTALIDGFEETMWIDSDVGFQPLPEVEQYDFKDNVPFIHNLDPAHAGPLHNARDIRSKPDFWVIHTVGSYEAALLHDNDPNNENNTYPGHQGSPYYTGWTFSESADTSNAVFFETIRDIILDDSNPGEPVELRQNGFDNIYAITVSHEAMHRFLGWHHVVGEPWTNENLMNSTTALRLPNDDLSLTPEQFRIVQATERPE